MVRKTSKKLVTKVRAVVKGSVGADKFTKYWCIRQRLVTYRVKTSKVGKALSIIEA